MVEAAELDLRLDGGVPLQTGQRHQIHVVKRHLRQLADMGLHENGGLGGVDAAGQIVQRHLHDVVADLLGMVEVVGEGLRVGDHEEQLLEAAAVLEHDAVAQGANIVAYVETSGRTVAGEDDLAHSFNSFLYVRYFLLVKQKRPVPWNSMGQDVQYVPAVPPKLAKRPLCTHDHALRRDNGRGCRRVLLTCSGFLPALVRPFAVHSAAALPPMRRSLKGSCTGTSLTQRFGI